MRFGKVLLYQNAVSFRDVLFLAYYSDSATAAACCWLLNEKVLVIVEFPFVLKTFVVLRHQVSVWCYLKVFSVSASLALNVSPQITFVADVPRSCKVI